MTLVFDERFEEKLVTILDYIMQDSMEASIVFEESLLTHLDQLLLFPYKFRKSFYYDKEKVRDYIFKGYTIPYYIDEENEKIVILDIFKWTEEERRQ
jgi:plasmid stabilization system protein ParE